ncbi:thiamine phosphate synthase [Methylobacterium aerolatum]|uniref:Thiamine-phosphate pyrophosphorylase n=1 Tax=Methylobacterium aerolatum TaxID=418708 RepID=A0ABU0I5M1_9HYPH|nr:thiamine phosphate synthase [Methylobacterium aerolatum]MDQ0449382.1 thiamine-phosphate pyrophosphorylase [Methylobacterium aerolatum]GJD36669.1 Thiamine-phosphate synthase [Methylobacterium aerolatum]
MAEQRLALLGPHGLDAAGAESLLPALEAACAAGDVAAVILRLAAADERSLVTLVKKAAAITQAREAALVIACHDFAGDLVQVAARGGADGVHRDKPQDPASDLGDLRRRLKDGRILGAGGLEAKHSAMEAGEAGVDYLLFGGLYPDGVAPDPQTVRDRAAWWAEIFETPCIAVASAEADLPALVATGAEFVGLESALWATDPAAVGRAQALLGDLAA